MLQISFRLRLTLWYTVIVAVPLGLFGVFNYLSVQQELNNNLDSSLQRVAESLDFIIREKQRETQQPLRPATTENSLKRSKKDTKPTPDYFEFLRTEQRRRSKIVGPMLPPKDTAAQNAAKADVVWSAVYEHILLNPKNYFIQVNDTSNSVVWRSENLRQHRLPPASAAMFAGDALPFRYTVPRYTLGKQTLRLFLYTSQSTQIIVGYPMDEIETTLNDLFASQILLLPVVLLVAVASGWFLAKYFVQPVEDITRLAREITAHNLSQRLPERRVNDEISRLTNTLNAMISRLEASFKQIQQFTGDASHELRTPLAILMGELEIALHSEQSPEEYQETIASALEEVHRLTQVVKNLLELSRADSGQVNIERKPLHLSLLMEDMVEDAMILAEEKAIHVSSNVEPDVWLHGDKVRLHEAILNVIDNAVKYTPAGGNINISLRTQRKDIYEDEALISVSDTGIGIPEEDISNIFDRFYRVDKSRSGEISGHGLGLSIVKWVIEAHQGRIKVTSHFGKGTIFFMWLPLERREEQDADNTAPHLIAYTD